MIEDAHDHGGLGDEADHAHLASAARTHEGVQEGVDFVHPADHLHPAAPEGRAVRALRHRFTLGDLAWRGELSRRGGLLALAASGAERQRAQQLPVVQEVDPQHLGDREDPLGMAHLLHDLVMEESRELRRPLGSARGAQPSSLAGKRHQELLGTAPAANPREAALPNATVEVARDHIVHESSPEAVVALEALLPRALDPVVERIEETVERRLPRIPRSVGPATDLHAQPEAGGRDAGSKRRWTLRLRGRSL